MSLKNDIDARQMSADKMLRTGVKDQKEISSFHRKNKKKTFR